MLAAMHGQSSGETVPTPSAACSRFGAYAARLAQAGVAALLLVSSASAEDNAVERTAKKAAEATERGVKRGVDATERGLKSAAKGVERGAKATGKALDNAAKKTENWVNEKTK